VAIWHKNREKELSWVGCTIIILADNDLERWLLLYLDIRVLCRKELYNKIVKSSDILNINGWINLEYNELCNLLRKYFREGIVLKLCDT